MLCLSFAHAASPHVIRRLPGAPGLGTTAALANNPSTTLGFGGGASTIGGGMYSASGPYSSLYRPGFGSYGAGCPFSFRP